MSTKTAAQVADEKAGLHVVDASTPVLSFAPSPLTVDSFKATKVRANPYDEIVLRSHTEHQPFEAPVPHSAGADVNAEVLAQVSLLKSAARFHQVGLTYHVIEGKTDADRKLWFFAKPKAVRKPKPTQS